MEYPACRKLMLKGYSVHIKVMPWGPDQASTCDQLRVRMCCKSLIVLKSDWLTSTGFLKSLAIFNGPPGNKATIESFNTAAMNASEEQINTDLKVCEVHGIETSRYQTFCFRHRLNLKEMCSHVYRQDISIIF